ncbi:hypothetical protein [Aliarcobacter lanthieri]|uniref:hypothetical protein n=1 Tax=Aliarcobacter lanthieri TaxID=1355374 RepID=UPI00047B6A25|nr:hypothetical protein [Aliarcobacter lanthieri]
MEKNNFIDVIAIIISSASALYTFFATRQVRQNAKESFKNNLRDKIKSIKYEIFKIEKNKLGHRESTIFMESIRDLMIYQQYTEEKKIYLNKEANKFLSELQEDIEDCIGILLINDDDEYRDTTIEKINQFLELI